MSSHRLALCTCALVLAVPSLAQNLATYGLTSTWPAGYYVAGGTFPNEIHLRSGSLSSPQTEKWSDAGITPAGRMPDYAHVQDVVFPPSSGRTNFTLSVDAHSTSNANIPIFSFDAAGSSAVPSLSNDQWFALSLSLEAGDDGNNNSLFQYSGIETVGYYFEQSGSIPTRLRGQAAAELRRSGFGLNGQSSAYLRALDYGMGFVSYEVEDMPEQGMFQNTAAYYFSVDAAFAAAHVNDWFTGGPTSQAAPHPGTIYRRFWNPILLSWGEPEVFISYEELGLSEENGDLDALDINTTNGSIIFSVTSAASETFDPVLPAANRSQLMVCMYDTGTKQVTEGPAPLKDSKPTTAPTKVTTRVKIQDVGGGADDQVTALCGIDPEYSMSDLRAGMPFGPAASDHVGLSMARGGWGLPGGGAGSQLTVDVTGWGGLTPGVGWIVLYRTPFGTVNWKRVATVKRLNPLVSPDGPAPFNSIALPAPDPTLSVTDWEYKAVLVLPTGTRFSTPLQILN